MAEDEQNQNVQSSAVAVKAPKFDEAAANRWFQILESQFVLANITVDSTKFHIAFSNLPVSDRLVIVLLLIILLIMILNLL